MSQSSFLAPRQLRRMLPLVTAVLLLAGCDSSGGSSQTAEFPKMGKANVQTSAPKAPAKGMDRIGSESGVPNP